MFWLKRYILYCVCWIREKKNSEICWYVLNILNANCELAGIQYQVAYCSVVIHIHTCIYVYIGKNRLEASLQQKSEVSLATCWGQPFLSSGGRQQFWREDAERPKETLHPLERRSRVSNLRRSNAAGSDRNKSTYRYKSPGRQRRR